MSLSRKKEDKVEGTGRIHVMKNRYGMDGMTFNAKVDTTTGHIELLDGDEGDTPKPITKLPTFPPDSPWDNSDLLSLRNQFSELEDLI